MSLPGRSDGSNAPPHPEVARVAALGRRVETPCGDGAMVWRLWGDDAGGALPLVLLHGGYGSWTHWIRNVLPLSRRRLVVAADLPGLGESTEPPGPHTPQSIAAIVADGLQRVLPAGSRCDLAGFSFGGMTGGHVTAMLPQRVRRLVLVGAAGLGLRRDPPPEEMRREPPGLDAEAAQALYRRNLEILMFADPAKIDDLAVALQMWNVRRARVKSRPLSRGDSLRRALEATRPDLAGLWGELDGTTHPYMDERRELLSAIRPGLRFEIVPGAGHWVHYEAADRFNVLLEELLAAP